MINLIHRYVLAWTTSAALTLAGLRLVTPAFVDFIIDLLTVGLVALAAHLAKQKTKP